MELFKFSYYDKWTKLNYFDTKELAHWMKIHKAPILAKTAICYHYINGLHMSEFE